MKFVPVMAVCVALTGCAAKITETHSPDGRTAYAISCSGASRGWDKCLAAAGDLCRDKGYDVIHSSEQPVVVVGGNRGQFFGGTTSDRFMTVACRP